MKNLKFDLALHKSNSFLYSTRIERKSLSSSVQWQLCWFMDASGLRGCFILHSAPSFQFLDPTTPPRPANQPTNQPPQPSTMRCFQTTRLWSILYPQANVNGIQRKIYTYIHIYMEIYIVHHRTTVCDALKLNNKSLWTMIETQRTV